MSGSQHTIGIVIPAFKPDVEQLQTYIKNIEAEISPETIHIELDEPNRHTLRVLDDLGVDTNYVERRRGKGAAINAGFRQLDTDIYAFVDADAATPVDSLQKILSNIQGEKVDVAVGSRRHPNSIIHSTQSHYRQFLGDGFSWLARRFIEPNLFDYQCGAKALKADLWLEAQDYVKLEGFAWDINLLAVAAELGANIIEIPIEWTDQPGSTVHPITDSLQMIYGLFAAFYWAKVAKRNSLG